MNAHPGIFSDTKFTPMLGAHVWCYTSLEDATKHYDWINVGTAMIRTPIYPLKLITRKNKTWVIFELAKPIATSKRKSLLSGSLFITHFAMWRHDLTPCED